MPCPAGCHSPEELIEGVHQVSDIGLTVTVSCKEEHSIEPVVETPKNSDELEKFFKEDTEEQKEKSNTNIYGKQTQRSEEDEETEEDDEGNNGGKGIGLPYQSHPPIPRRRFHIATQKYNCYTPEDLQKAYDAITKQGLPVRMVSKLYGIPRSTLYDRISNRSPLSLGGKPNTLKTRILEEDTERQMVGHIQHMEQIGHALGQSDILSLATKLAQSAGTVAKGRVLSRSWYKAFLRRWPSIGGTTSGELQKPKSELTLYKQPKSKEEFLSSLESVMENHKLLARPHFIYKVDEIVLTFDKKASLTPQIQKRSEVLSVSGRSTVTCTILLCGNALGYSLPPYFLYQNKMKNSKNAQGSMDGSTFRYSDSGLSSRVVLREFVKNHFIPNLVKNKGDVVLLLYSDSFSAVTTSLCQWAAANDVIIFTLPSQVTDPSDSLDFGCFFEFTNAFNDVCSEYTLEYGNIQSHKIAQLVYQAMLKSVTVRILKSAFREACVYPFVSKRKSEEATQTTVNSSNIHRKRSREFGKKKNKKTKL